MGRPPKPKRGAGYCTLRVTAAAQRALIRIARASGESLTEAATRIILEKSLTR